MDDRHIERLNESEVVEHIGELLAIAIARSGRLLRNPAAQRANVPSTLASVVDSVALVRDPVERKLAEFLKHAGPCSTQRYRYNPGPRPLARRSETPAPACRGNLRGRGQDEGVPLPTAGGLPAKLTTRSIYCGGEERVLGRQ